MKFIYTTDLHGHIEKYEAVFKFALYYKINLIHLGADLLPKWNPIFQAQKNFIDEYLMDFYGRCRQNKIEVLAFFGDSDLIALKNNFRQYSQLLDENPVNRDGYDFVAYGHVPDCPVSLIKGGEPDYKEWKHLDNYLNDPIEAESNRFSKIKKIYAYFKRKVINEKPMKSLTQKSKEIVSFHYPPAFLNLDISREPELAGSKYIYQWIEKKQPLLVLCGHVHDAPNMTWKWKEKIGKTIVVQPGQEWDKTTLVLVEILKSTVHTDRISIP
jgi:Icc-related predicted phosphoesterase